MGRKLLETNDFSGKRGGEHSKQATLLCVNTLFPASPLDYNEKCAERPGKRDRRCGGILHERPALPAGLCKTSSRLLKRVARPVRERHRVTTKTAAKNWRKKTSLNVSKTYLSLISHYVHGHFVFLFI